MNHISDNFRHPCHATIRSPWPKTAVLGQLTNRRIHHYALRGYYGRANQLAAQENDKQKKSRPTKKPSAFALALAALT